MPQFFKIRLACSESMSLNAMFINHSTMSLDVLCACQWVHKITLDGIRESGVIGMRKCIAAFPLHLRRKRRDGHGRHHGLRGI